MKTLCCWCLSPIKVTGKFNPKTDKDVCSQGCKDAEHLFCIHFSDEQINRRHHYRQLTSQGES